METPSLPVVREIAERAVAKGWSGECSPVVTPERVNTHPWKGTDPKPRERRPVKPITLGPDVICPQCDGPFEDGLFLAEL